MDENDALVLCVLFAVVCIIWVAALINNYFQSMERLDTTYGKCVDACLDGVGIITSSGEFNKCMVNCDKFADRHNNTLN